MMNSIYYSINELSTSLLNELTPDTLTELRNTPYAAIHKQSDTGLGVYIRNAYLSHKSIFREESYEDICDAIIEKLWCHLQVQKI